MRQKLINNGAIHERTISTTQLSNYSHFSLINAMIDLKQDSDQNYQINLISFNKL